MATWTSTNLANAVLENIGIKSAGQDAAAEDLLLITKLWASVYPQLRRLGLAPWGSEAIEEAFQEPLAKYMAGQALDKFVVTGARAQLLNAMADLGYKQLQEQAASDRSVAPIRPDYF